jgi:hypothetical protein
MGAHPANFLAAVFRRGHSKKVAEQYLCAVDQVNVHEEAMLYEAVALVRGQLLGSQRFHR